MPKIGPFVDRFGRPVTHLRLSVTNRCNHDCIFCHREGILKTPEYEMSPDEIGFLTEVLSSVGVKYVKLTGGEPLVRGDIVEVVKAISPHAEVSMVTNGSLLKHFASGLAEAGLARLNISLHSLNPAVFREITRGRLEQVLEGIRAAVDSGLPIKFDVVTLKHNSRELRDLVRFAIKVGADINLIELIPIGMGFHEWKRLHADVAPVEEWLAEMAVRVERLPFQNRTVYRMPEGISVYVIKGYGNPELCAACTRIRMAPDGKFKTCIYRQDYIDALPAIKARDRDALIKVFRRAVDMREPFFKKVPVKESGVRRGAENPADG